MLKRLFSARFCNCFDRWNGSELKLRNLMSHKHLIRKCSSNGGDAKGRGCVTTISILFTTFSYLSTSTPSITMLGSRLATKSVSAIRPSIRPCVQLSLTKSRLSSDRKPNSHHGHNAGDDWFIRLMKNRAMGVHNRRRHIGNTFKH